jgi:hypothetical protein
VKRSGEKKIHKMDEERVDTDTRGALVGGKRRIEVCFTTNYSSVHA